HDALPILARRALYGLRSSALDTAIHTTAGAPATGHHVGGASLAAARLPVPRGRRGSADGDADPRDRRRRRRPDAAPGFIAVSHPAQHRFDEAETAARRGSHRRGLYSRPWAADRDDGIVAGGDKRGTPVSYRHRLQRRGTAQPARAGSYHHLSILGTHLHRAATLRPLPASARRPVGAL